MSFWSTDVLEKLSQKVSLVTKMNSDHGSRQKNGELHSVSRSCREIHEQGSRIKLVLSELVVPNKKILT